MLKYVFLMDFFGNFRLRTHFRSELRQNQLI